MKLGLLTIMFCLLAGCSGSRKHQATFISDTNVMVNPQSTKTGTKLPYLGHEDVLKAEPWMLEQGINPAIGPISACVSLLQPQFAQLQRAWETINAVWGGKRSARELPETVTTLQDMERYFRANKLDFCRNDVDWTVLTGPLSLSVTGLLGALAPAYDAVASTPVGQTSRAGYSVATTDLWKFHTGLYDVLTALYCEIGPPYDTRPCRR